MTPRILARKHIGLVHNAADTAKHDREFNRRLSGLR